MGLWGPVSGLFAVLAIQGAIALAGTDSPIPVALKWITGLVIAALVEVGQILALYEHDQKCIEDRRRLEHERDEESARADDMAKQRNEAWAELYGRTQQAQQAAQVAQQITGQGPMP